MQLTEQLVQGVDVWINTPRRPWEASGTSGMKVLVNGGLNLSELDGWWVEAYAPDVGWALGDGREHGEDPAWDAAEAATLFDLLEREIIPEFYQRDGQGIPRSWVKRVRESMARLTPAYSANRSVREYVEQCYMPAAAAYRRRAQRNGALGVEIVDWRAGVARNWPGVRFGRVTIKTLATGHEFTVEVIPGALPAQSLRVELYADRCGDAAAVRQKMQRLDGRIGASGAELYTASVPASRPAGDYTARIVPAFPDVSVPLEAPYILWQR
jgi:starch phosphorylase